ncbi:MAG: hypothetical protein QOF63_2902, partial [Thermoanaerobaculia bacterium]|nr:hypothetical protein [Thermoanaerobaculia bacterium]
LPIFVANRTDAFVKLFAARVEPFIFGMFHHPSMPADAFSETRKMRDEILCLPIHQDLGDADVDRLATLARGVL